MFPRPEIEERLSKFVRVRLWTNDRKPEARSEEWAALLRERFRTSAIPLYATLAPDGSTIGSLAFPGGSTDAFAKRMAALLDEALERFPPK